MSAAVTRSRRGEAGFTLIELMVSIGIFGILMALVSVLLINGLSSIRDASTANTVQAQQQNAMLVLSRQITYVDNPINSGVPPAAVLLATPTSMVVFTLSGAGPVDRLPYKVMVCRTTRGVETFSWAPTLVNGAAVLDTTPDMTVPTCDDAGAAGSFRRILLPDDGDTSPAVAFRYWDADGVELIPAGQLSAAQLDELSRVTVSLSDPALGSPLEQTITLVNER